MQIIPQFPTRNYSRDRNLLLLIKDLSHGPVLPERCGGVEQEGGLCAVTAAAAGTAVLPQLTVPTVVVGGKRIECESAGLEAGR